MSGIANFFDLPEMTNEGTTSFDNLVCIPNECDWMDMSLHKVAAREGKYMTVLKKIGEQFSAMFCCDLPI